MANDKVTSAVNWAINIANDNSHGYDQVDRWGVHGNYDCSGLVISAFQQAGIKVKTAGASYTGDMRPAFLKCGFKDVVNSIVLSNGKGLEYGDVLLYEGHHTAIYIGNGKIVHAAINELGKVTGGKSGDQTGGEICVRSYYNRPWNHVLRYTEADSANTTGASFKDYIKQLQQAINNEYGAGLEVDGIQGPLTYAACPTLNRYTRANRPQTVKALQQLLTYWGHATAIDGDFYKNTEAAVKAFQRDKCGYNYPDGEVTQGFKTWKKLINY